MTAERIHNLTKRIGELEEQLQAERNRNRSIQTMVEATSWQRFVTLNANLGAYKDSNVGILVKLLHVLQEAVDASDPLRGAPMSDTARVGHPELTSTEAAVMSKRKERALIPRANRWIGGLVDRIEGELINEPTPDRSNAGRLAAHHRWHKEATKDGCEYCQAKSA